VLAQLPRSAVTTFGPRGSEVPVTIAAETSATLTAPATAMLTDVSLAPSASMAVPSGASLTVPGGATVSSPDASAAGARQVKVGETIQVPPGTCIHVLAGSVMTVPGTSDITVDPGGTLLITRNENNENNENNGSNGSNRSLVIPSDAVAPLPGAKSAGDATLSYPVRIAVPAGAKITVTGIADIMLPRGTQSTVPYHRNRPLSAPHSLQVPPGSGVVITGNLAMVLVAAVITMFGIGAELGIIGVLAYDLSEATLTWRCWMLVAVALAAVLLVGYAASAIRATADPRPGSSLSAAQGTSFTL
jgi:hypothetical protein